MVFGFILDYQTSVELYFPGLLELNSPGAGALEARTWLSKYNGEMTGGHHEKQGSPQWPLSMQSQHKAGKVFEMSWGTETWLNVVTTLNGGRDVPSLAETGVMVPGFIVEHEAFTR